MSEAYIVRRGGGVKMFAAIGVTYPAGSTLTCTDGKKTLKAKTTTGQWVFAVPYAGTWIVTATDGTKSKSQTFKITTEGQLESVKLSYELLLYNAGDQCTSVTGGWASGGRKGAGYSAGSASFNSSDVSITVPANGSCFVYTKNKINLTGYNSLTINVTQKPATNGYFGIYVLDGTAVDQWGFTSQVANKESIKTTGNHTLDVSSVNKSCYIAVAVDSGTACTGKFNSVKLT